jgi:hypothetical protein
MPTLVIVDAWLDTVPAAYSVRDPQQARLALHQWKELATYTDAAVTLICHTNRLATASARDRYGATAALRQKARMSLYCQTDDDGRLLVGPEKANGTTTVPASVFTIEPVPLFAPTADDDGTVPRLVYVGESDQTARQHVAHAFAAEHDASPSDDAVAWLALEFAAGPRWVADIKAAGEAAGYSEYQLNRAKAKLGAKSKNPGAPNAWYWALPHHRDSAPDPIHRNLATSLSPLVRGDSALSPLSDRDSASTSGDRVITNGEIQGSPRNLPSSAKSGFNSPTGPGRCPQCGFHIETQGHRDNCPANKERNQP